ncbi:transposase [Acinetobacter sichuanensis]|uniref:Transposase n=1 Tax=Acinetobacter sichuanensis TaxID=2136183 RepID=A0A371YKT8_9GAMM|nr:hypothetical protein C9E89_018350 [Acinetobacter sichuanensis]
MNRKRYSAAHRTVVKKRRTYSKEFKLSIVNTYKETSTSIASVALQYGLNACLGRITQGTGNMIRIDEIWLSTQPMECVQGWILHLLKFSKHSAASNLIVLICSVINVAIA